MERVTHRVPSEQIDEIDDLVDAGVYANRSEFIREGIRELLYECPDADDAVASIEPDTTHYGSRLPGGDD